MVKFIQLNRNHKLNHLLRLMDHEYCTLLCAQMDLGNVSMSQDRTEKESLLMVPEMYYNDWNSKANGDGGRS